MASTSLKNKTAFAFLQDVKKKFRDMYTSEQILDAKDYDMSAGFSTVYKDLIVRYILIFFRKCTIAHPKTKITKISS